MPWASPAGRDGPSEPHAAGQEPEEVSAEGEQADIVAAAYQAGLAEGLVQAADAARADSEALAAIASHLAVLADQRDCVEQQLLGGAIARLVTHIVGETSPNAATMMHRASTLIAGLRNNVSAIELHCNPVDARLLRNECAGLPVVACAALPRGTLRIATQSGWVEDSIGDRLSRVTAELLGSTSP